MDPVIPPAELSAEYDRLLTFGRRFPDPDGGAAWLGDDGSPQLGRPVFAYITARMAHVYLLGAMTGFPGADVLAGKAIDALRGRLRDTEDGGWFTHVGGGEPDGTVKDCYAHAFVALAASTAAVADHRAGRELLDDALAVWLGRFWDDERGMFVDSWDRPFVHADSYRGMNANMHGVEALLAAADATGDPSHLHKAGRVAGRLVDEASRHSWRIPEHYDPAWLPLLGYNADHPADPFKPFGATVGHALEWSRLLLHLDAATGGDDQGLVDVARSLFDRAVADGWARDGAAGFVYTTDFDGRPIVHDRLHWVLCEGLAAAASLHTRTGEARYAALAQEWWAYAKRHLLDLDRGSWHHQLDQWNQPVSSVWSGKPDLYHAIQATLIPRLPLAPGLAMAVGQGMLVN